jgi:hypothetical protein
MLDYYIIKFIIIIIITIINFTADQFCNYTVFMSSKHAENLRNWKIHI